MTDYCCDRFKELRKLGLVNSKGEITRKGYKWIKDNPNEEPRRWLTFRSIISGQPESLKVFEK